MRLSTHALQVQCVCCCCKRTHGHRFCCCWTRQHSQPPKRQLQEKVHTHTTHAHLRARRSCCWLPVRSISSRSSLSMLSSPRVRPLIMPAIATTATTATVRECHSSREGQQAHWLSTAGDACMGEPGQLVRCIQGASRQLESCGERARGVWSAATGGGGKGSTASAPPAKPAVVAGPKGGPSSATSSTLSIS